MKFDPSDRNRPNRDADRRLRDRLDATDPDLRLAATLLSSPRAESPTAASKHRVWTQVMEPRGRTSPAWLVRPALAVVILCGFAAAAGATLQRGGWVRRVLFSETAPRVVIPTVRPPRSSGARTREVPAHEAPPAPAKVSPPAVSVPLPVAPLHPTIEPVHPAPRKESLVRAPLPVADPPVAPPSRDAMPLREASAKDAPHPVAVARDDVPGAAGDLELKLVVDGVNALRRDHDADRAGALLGEYLRRNPDGMMAEEALVYAIEAAHARHDAAAASSLGARYLALYPRGRYRSIAQNAIR